MSILLLGASRNIGHHVAHILLHDQQSPSAPELKLTLLLRNDLPSDDSLTPFIASGQVQIVKGDAMKREDIQRAWDVAGGADVRAVVYTVGTPAAERSIGLGGGLTHLNPNLCTLAMANLLAVIASTPGGADPKVVALSTVGLGEEAHARLPIVLRGLYSWVLGAAHEDKIGMEHLLHLATLNGPNPLRAVAPLPPAHILPDDLLPSLDLGDLGRPTTTPKTAFALTDVIIVRAGALTDSPSLLTAHETNAPRGYEAEVDMWKPHAVSREEVARFVVEECLVGLGGGGMGVEGKWTGKTVDVAKRGWW